MFRKNVILEQCKGVHCVDLGESFQTHIYLQNLASIQPRTSPVKFATNAARRTRPLNLCSEVTLNVDSLEAAAAKEQCVSALCQPLLGTVALLSTNDFENTSTAVVIAFKRRYVIIIVLLQGRLPTASSSFSLSVCCLEFDRFCSRVSLSCRISSPSRCPAVGRASRSGLGLGTRLRLGG